ncbi:holin family protein [Oxobacter pfennigii]|uniref:Holin family protein n=1 Tax=Oxobacter pfennigii TaxID=36849 RepID=A0A0N8NSZ6_9CLOT|nr:phage holin family protein [Oxobacter pfennigii]KPU43416.1 holin family protein [Oxobacter pfennigii]
MDNFFEIVQNWHEKLAISLVISYFSQFQTSILVLVILIMLDTIFGISNAIKQKRFYFSKLKKLFKKLITYFSSIATIRLVEIGVASFIQTSFLTNIISSFLIITESLSILKNLTLLGAPLPSGFSKLIMKYLRIEPLDDLLTSNTNVQSYISEIMDMMDYQVPGIKDEPMKVILKIRLEEWARFITSLDLQFLENNTKDNDLIFFRVASLFNTAEEVINTKIADAGISDECIKTFNNWNEPQFKKWLEGIREVCYSDISPERKKSLIFEKIIVAAYQAIVDVQKGEALLFKNNCKN